ncbi:MAG: amino acid permease, partial [candidate division NC10 bacterium]|nr:amino acid permease [candidate division NC10 bacterium]
MASSLKRLLLGDPLATAQARHERLGKVTGLAVFASDNLSSVAYATEEILLALALAGPAAFAWTLPIGTAIGLLLVVVATSYWQTVHAYPSGGGAYIVALQNLGKTAGLTAAAALLIDYVLTV